MNISSICVLCNDLEGNRNQLFFYCLFSYFVLSESLRVVSLTSCPGNWSLHCKRTLKIVRGKSFKAKVRATVHVSYCFVYCLEREKLQVVERDKYIPKELVHKILWRFT